MVDGGSGRASSPQGRPSASSAQSPRTPAMCRAEGDAGWKGGCGARGARGLGGTGAGMTSLATRLGVGPGVLWRGGGRGQGAQRGTAEGEPSGRVGRGGWGFAHLVDELHNALAVAELHHARRRLVQVVRVGHQRWLGRAHQRQPLRRPLNLRLPLGRLTSSGLGRGPQVGEVHGSPSLHGLLPVRARRGACGRLDRPQVDLEGLAIDRDRPCARGFLSAGTWLGLGLG